jgi:hypothetical protein
LNWGLDQMGILVRELRFFRIGSFSGRSLCSRGGPFDFAQGRLRPPIHNPLI